MPLSWNEIKFRALTPSRKWMGAANECGAAQPFLIDFIELSGITGKQQAAVETAARGMLDSRAAHANAPRADLCGPHLSSLLPAAAKTARRRAVNAF